LQRVLSGTDCRSVRFSAHTTNSSKRRNPVPAQLLTSSSRRLIIAKRRPNWSPFYCSLNVVGDFFCGVSAILRFLQLPFGLVPELTVPSIWPVALFPEFVSTLSDLIFCWLEASLTSGSDPAHIRGCRLARYGLDERAVPRLQWINCSFS
jgi:hypothetical protein